MSIVASHRVNSSSHWIESNWNSKEFRSKVGTLRTRIEHSTRYTYRRPVAFGPHRLVLRPREGHDLHVESMSLDISPAHHLLWTHDIYNNSIAIVNFLEDAAQLDFQSTVVVRRSIHTTTSDSVKWNVPSPVAYSELEMPIVSAYQTLSYPDDRNGIDLWLDRFSEVARSHDAPSRVSSLCSIIYREIRYNRRFAKGVQSPAETIRLGSGSCRDLATLMMDAARSMGLAARFASGYLDCPASEAGLASMHAWTEVYLPYWGWRGFDPTLGEAVSQKHITVGVSQHPRGVMPISGWFTSSGADYLNLVAQVRLQKVEE